MRPGREFDHLRSHNAEINLLKDEAQAALFKYLIRTAL
jgi:hypothetical protein